MTAPGRRRRDIVTAIIAKDLRLFNRDRFYAFVSVLTLVLFGGLFWLLPSTLDDTIHLGVHLPGGDELLAAAGDDESLVVHVHDDRESLTRAVRSGEVVAGLDFPSTFLGDVAMSRPTSVRVLLGDQTPPAIQEILGAVARELAFAVAGVDPPVELSDPEHMVLGTDRSAPLPLRDQMRPLLLLVVLLTEMFALASLVAVEIAQRTAPAVLVTPARVIDLVTAKATLGTAMALGQALLIALATGTLVAGSGPAVAALALGAVLVTGCALLAGSVGRDFVAIVFWSMLAFVPLAIPAFAVLFPGTPALWIRALPSHGLVETLVRVTGHGQSWADVWAHLAVLASWCVALLAAGLAVLSRRLRSV